MSYFLAANANLGDLYDADKSRKSLNIGPMETQNANDVYIQNANILTSSLQMLYDKSLNIRKHISYIKCLDNKGTCIWFANDSWASDEYIHVSSFFNDIDLVSHPQLTKTSISGSFDDLDNTPKTQDVFDNLGEIPPLLLIDSNLQDMQNKNKSLLSKSLEIGDVSFENNDSLVLTGISCEKFFYPDYSGLHGSLLTSEDDSILINGLRTNKTKWKHPFINDDGSVKNQLRLLDSYKKTSATNTVTARALKNMYDDTLFRINKKHSNFNKERIKNTLSNYAQDGVLLQTSNHLGEPELDTDLSKRNIGLGTSASQNASNVSFIKLSVNDNITFNNASNNDDFLHLVFTCTDLHGSCQLSNVKSATENEYGFTKHVFNVFDSNVPSNGVISWKLLEKLKNGITRNLNTFQRNGFLNNFGQFSNDIGTFLDRNMSQLENNEDELVAIHQNLELSGIATTGDFFKLDDFPGSIDIFENDAGLLRKTENCVDMIQFASSNAFNIGCGDISIQDYGNIEIENGTASLNIIETDHLIIYPNERKILNKWLLVDENHHIKYNDLPHASENNYGTVIIINDYDSVSDSAAISIEAFKNMYNIVNEKINAVDREIFAYITTDAVSH